MDASWCVMGDFNKITIEDEKVGGRPRSLFQMEVFTSALETNDLLDLGWKEQKFTWSNRHSDKTFTMGRLNRVVANQRWLFAFENQGVKNFSHKHI